MREPSHRKMAANCACEDFRRLRSGLNSLKKCLGTGKSELETSPQLTASTATATAATQFLHIAGDKRLRMRLNSKEAEIESFD